MWHEHTDKCGHMPINVSRWPNEIFYRADSMGSPRPPRWRFPPTCSPCPCARPNLIGCAAQQTSTPRTSQTNSEGTPIPSGTLTRSRNRKRDTHPRPLNKAGRNVGARPRLARDRPCRDIPARARHASPLRPERYCMWTNPFTSEAIRTAAVGTGAIHPGHSKHGHHP